MTKTSFNNPNADHPVSLFALCDSLWRSRQLILQLTKREIVGRYRGSVMGILWSFFNPLLMLGIYTFVFSVVFKARWGGGGESKTEFALILFAGMIVFYLFSDCINLAPSIITSNVNYVKKVVFPLEVLVLVSLGSSIFHFFVSFIVWFVFYVVFLGWPHSTIFLLPLVLAPLILYTVGFSWFLASVGVYLPDVRQFISVVVTVLMFLSPIFYPVTSLPENYRCFIYLNPVAPVIEQARQVLLWGEVPNLKVWVISFGCGSLVAWLGYFWFQKTRKGFADVL